MLGSNETLFPLEEVTETHLKKLCHVLWNWEFCDQCNIEQACQTKGCPWQKLWKFQSFFQFYKEITAWRSPEIFSDGNYALRSHEDLFGIIQLLKEKLNVARSILTEEYFSIYGRKCAPDITDQHRAFNLAIRVMAMVHCSATNQSPNDLELGSDPVNWSNNETRREFMELTFPTRDFPILNEGHGSSGIQRQLIAKRLKSIAGLKFQGTDNLRNHLSLDVNTGVLQIFHHTAFLKEYLIATKDTGTMDSMSGSRETAMPEIIPRQLALQTIDSIQKILFPLDQDSRKFLASLVSKNELDPDCIQLGCGTSYRRDYEKEISYRYWGSRLMHLYSELSDPKPRGILQGWLHMRRKGRHVMMATIAGVIFAVILGVLTLAVGIFQSWVSYQQWKHPVATVNN